MPLGLIDEQRECAKHLIVGNTCARARNIATKWFQASRICYPDGDMAPSQIADRKTELAAEVVGRKLDPIAEFKAWPILGLVTAVRKPNPV